MEGGPRGEDQEVLSERDEPGPGWLALVCHLEIDWETERIPEQQELGRRELDSEDSDISSENYQVDLLLALLPQELGLGLEFYLREAEQDSAEDLAVLVSGSEE